LQFGPEQNEEAGDPESKASLASSRNVMVAEQEGIEHKKPERCNRDDQCRQAGGYSEFGVGEGEIASHKQQKSDH